METGSKTNGQTVLEFLRELNAVNALVQLRLQTNAPSVKPHDNFLGSHHGVNSELSPPRDQVVHL